MKKHFYMKGDGNGGVVISKTLIALFCFLIIMGTLIARQAFAYGSLNNEVEDIIEKLDKNIEEDDEKHSEFHDAIIEIKSDFKYIKKEIEDINKKLK